MSVAVLLVRFSSMLRKTRVLNHYATVSDLCKASSYFEKEFADLELPFRCSLMQGRELPQVSSVHACAVLDELLRDFVVAVRTSVVQRNQTTTKQKLVSPV